MCIKNLSWACPPRFSSFNTYNIQYISSLLASVLGDMGMGAFCEADHLAVISGSYYRLAGHIASTIRKKDIMMQSGRKVKRKRKLQGYNKVHSIITKNRITKWVVNKIINLGTRQIKERDSWRVAHEPWHCC